MFERRLKLVLVLLFVITTVLLVRAVQLQIVTRRHWAEQATETLKREQEVDTTRGTIFDVRGVPIALDAACIDACVDYRAIIDPPDPQWVAKLAAQWARSRRGEEYRSADSTRKKAIVEEEKQHVADRIKLMWEQLARDSDRSLDEIEEVRRGIARKVEMRRRAVWYRKFQIAREAHADKNDREPSPWWKQWLIDETQDAPQLDDFAVKVSEQTESHPILSAISSDLQNKLGKSIDDYPGLVLRPGMTRSYPFGEATCHLVGHLTRVTRKDLDYDPYDHDSFRKYQFNDLIGRSGLEALCEPLLRGKRGRYTGNEDGEVTDRLEPEPGQNVQCSIDVALQEEVLHLFQQAKVEFGEGIEPRNIALHGGAVLIDVRSGELRVLVSNPTFDPNTLDTDYSKLVSDKLNRPLLSRATQYPLETGSTIKPVVGLGAITQGLIGVNEGIECTGYLRIGGRRYTVGRCWTASKFAAQYGDEMVRHHGIPTEHPHRGHDGNADGFLTFSDALERSCNVYFETVADRLGLDGLSFWLERFGLGRPTGVGIEESRGRLPDTYKGPNVEFAAWTAGIGQGAISATTLQMANVAASIARDGIWMRPTLVTTKQVETLRTQSRAASTQPSSPGAWWNVPDKINLQLAPVALAAAHDGMYRVVNSPAGTGTSLRSNVVVIAGKTGTAQAAPFMRRVLDANGQPTYDENGRIKTEPLIPSTPQQANPEAPWYLAWDSEGKNIKHAWIIGYAPAQNPQVAFAVMVEYGGSGGNTAAVIAKGMLDAAIQHGYLSSDRTANNKPVAAVR